MLRDFRERVKGRLFLILGMGRAGRTLARMLLKANAEVVAYEEDEEIWGERTLKSLTVLGLRRVTQLDFYFLKRSVTVVASPGFPPSHPLIHLLSEHGFSIYDELDFASQFLPGVKIAVTGTNGKSTTVAIIASILKQAGAKVFVGGNLAPGRPLSAALGMSAKEFYVMEVSSFQLSRAQLLKPKVAVLLNITEDHLDRHQSFDDYIHCKSRIFQNQDDDDWAVLNRDDPVVYSLAENVRAQKVFFSTISKADGYIFRNQFWFRRQVMAPIYELIKQPLEFYNLRYLPVIENALAAVCVAGILQIPGEAVKKGLEHFQSLPHRFEFVRFLHGVYFFNNSMCTNPAAGIRSLMAWRKKVILITGGKEKNANIDRFLDAIIRRAKWVVLLGENSRRVAEGLDRLGYCKYEIATSMNDAVDRAYQRAKPGDVVLLSPGFASFDLFRNFQERGRSFRNAVRQLR